MNCQRCGDCCRFLLFPIGADEQGLYRWLGLHGVSVVIGSRPYAKVEFPCRLLEGDDCVRYHDRPEMCRLAPCLKEEVGTT